MRGRTSVRVLCRYCFWRISKCSPSRTPIHVFQWIDIVRHSDLAYGALDWRIWLPVPSSLPRFSAFVKLRLRFRVLRSSRAAAISLRPRRATCFCLRSACPAPCLSLAQHTRKWQRTWGVLHSISPQPRAPPWPMRARSPGYRYGCSHVGHDDIVMRTARHFRSRSPSSFHRDSHRQHWQGRVPQDRAHSGIQVRVGVRAGELIFPAPRAPAAIAPRFSRSASLAIRVFFRNSNAGSASRVCIPFRLQRAGSGTSPAFASTSVCVRSDFTRMLRTLNPNPTPICSALWSGRSEKARLFTVRALPRARKEQENTRALCEWCKKPSSHRTNPSVYMASLAISAYMVCGTGNMHSASLGGAQIFEYSSFKHRRLAVRHGYRFPT